MHVSVFSPAIPDPETDDTSIRTDKSHDKQNELASVVLVSSLFLIIFPFLDILPRFGY